MRELALEYAQNWHTEVRALSKPEEWIYLIEEAGSDACKVGITADSLAARVHKLQTGNHRQLEMSDCVRGDIHTERALHDALRPYRIRREWFRPAGMVRHIFYELHEEMLDAAEDEAAPLIPDGSMGVDVVNAAWLEQVATPDMVARAAGRAIAYWNSPERLEDEPDRPLAPTA